MEIYKAVVICCRDVLVCQLYWFRESLLLPSKVELPVDGGYVSGSCYLRLIGCVAGQLEYRHCSRVVHLMYTVCVL